MKVRADLKQYAKNFVRLQRAAISCFPCFPPHIVTPSNEATRVRAFARRRNAWQMSRSFFCIRPKDSISLTLKDSFLIVIIYLYESNHQCDFSILFKRFYFFVFKFFVFNFFIFGVVAYF